MTTWRIEFTLTSGVTLVGFHKNHETNSDEVAEYYLIGPGNEYVGLMGKDQFDNKSNLIIRRSDIAAINISICNETNYQ